MHFATYSHLRTATATELSYYRWETKGYLPLQPEFGGCGEKWVYTNMDYLENTPLNFCLIISKIKNFINIFAKKSNLPEFFSANFFIMLNSNWTNKITQTNPNKPNKPKQTQTKLLHNKVETLRYVPYNFCDEISKSWQMATDFVRVGLWTPCDIYVIIRRCDRNGLSTQPMPIKFVAMIE